MTEEWRSVSHWTGYDVSNTGLVRNTKTGRILKQMITVWGYLCVHLSNNNKSRKITVHRLVCEAFNGPPPTPKHEVRHWNGNKKDNRPDNLMWGTSAENAADRTRLGEQNPCQGEDHGHARLTKDNIIEIRRLYADGMSQRKIAMMFELHQGYVSRIVNGHAWKHVST